MTPEAAIKLVAEDVSGLKSVFAPVSDDEGDGFTAFTNEVLTNPGSTVVGVRWQYRCQHVGELLGIRPMQRVLTMKGFTVVYDEEPAQLRRYVDWAYVSSQLGIASSMQPLVNDLSAVYPTPR
jgi:hypothetical protein